MHDDELRDALERRAQRAVGHGPEAAMDRARRTPTETGGRQGSFVAALAVIGLIVGGLALAVAFAGDGDEDTEEEAEQPVLVPGVDPTPPPPTPEPAPLTSTVSTLALIDVLVVDATGGAALGEVLVESLVVPELTSVRLVDLPVERGLTAIIHRRAPADAFNIATLAGLQESLIREWVPQDRVLADPGDATVVILLGTDIVPAWEAFSLEGCTDIAAEFFGCGAVPDVLHPPPEVRVLVANGTGISGLAGSIADQLVADRGYAGLTPTNARRAAVSTSYFTPGYELDAIQIAQILDFAPDAVQPMPDPAPVDDLAGAHVLVVLGDDYGQ